MLGETLMEFEFDPVLHVYVMELLAVRSADVPIQTEELGDAVRLGTSTDTVDVLEELNVQPARSPATL